MTRPDGSVKALSQYELSTFGISMSLGSESAQIDIEQDDETLYRHSFELLFSSGSVEEPLFYNLTHVTVDYLQPPCGVS